MTNVLRAPACAHPALRHEPVASAAGWYESSWDLRRGLDVRELTEPDDRYTAAGGADPEPPSAT